MLTVSCRASVTFKVLGDHQNIIASRRCVDPMLVIAPFEWLGVTDLDLSFGATYGPNSPPVLTPKFSSKDNVSTPLWLSEAVLTTDMWSDIGDTFTKLA